MGYQPHARLSVPTRNSPRPFSLSSAGIPSSGSGGTGGFGSASHTSMSSPDCRADRRSQRDCGVSTGCAASTLLVTSSDTSSSASPVSLSPHSQSTCRACSRAQGTEPVSGPSSRVLCQALQAGRGQPRRAASRATSRAASRSWAAVPKAREVLVIMGTSQPVRAYDRQSWHTGHVCAQGV